MQFTFTPEHLALRDAVQQVCDDHLSMDRLTSGTGPAGPDGPWAALAEVGLFGLLVPEADGGAGLGALEATIAFERLGAHLAPGPLVWTTVGALVRTDAVDGSRRIGAVDPGQPPGEPVLVEHAPALDLLLVFTDAGVACVDAGVAPGPAGAEPVEPLDPLTPVGRLAEVPAGEVVAGAAEAGRLVRLATLLSAAMLAGVAQQALDVARRYCLDRHQFDVPIGSFQAPKHMLADMYVRSSLASTSTLAAAATVDDPEVGDADRAVHEAKLLAGEAALANARTSVQLLGGMGFTWDMPPNFLLKRAWVLDQSLGTADEHALAVAATMETGAR